MENYFPDGVPSTVLAIVQANASEEASLYTSSNNSPVNPGQTEEQGAAVPSGYTYITVNGDYNISSYAYTYVNVPGETKFGYAYITENGDYDIASYESVNVNVEGGSTGLGFPMLMFKEWSFENWRYAVADDSNNLTISFGLNDQAPDKMVDYVAVSSYNGENVDRMTLKPLSIDCSAAARENWPGSYSGFDYYYWSNAPADPEAEGYHYDSNADMAVSFFELTNLEDPVTGDTFEGEVTVNLSYNTTTGIWSATWNEAVVDGE